MLSGIIKFVFLALLGGIIAMVGDQVGRRVGRKRISIFNLRPRYTSLIFTVGFGMLISIVTIGIVSVVSKEARIALFEMDKLEKERQDLSIKVRQLGIVAAAGRLVFHANEPIYMGAITGGGPPQKMRQELLALLSKANDASVRKHNEIAKREGTTLLEPGHPITMHLPPDLERAVSQLLKTSQKMLVMVYSLQNTFLGGQVVARFDLYENSLVFEKEQIILAETVNGQKSREDILVQLFEIFSKLQDKAANSGMIPNPETNTFGGNLAVATLLDKSDQIRSMKTLVNIKVVAKSPIHRGDPLSVYLVLEPQN